MSTPNEGDAGLAHRRAAYAVTLMDGRRVARSLLETLLAARGDEDYVRGLSESLRELDRTLRLARGGAMADAIKTDVTLAMLDAEVGHLIRSARVLAEGLRDAALTERVLGEASRAAAAGE